MRLLVLSHNLKRASFRQRTGIYLDTLRKNGIDCEVAKLPSSPLARRRLFMRAKDFDGVFLHKKTLNPFDAYYLKKYGKKVIYDFDDAIMYDDKYPEKEHRKRQNSFHRTVRLADLVLAGNVYLAEHAQRFNARVEVLPTGLDTNAYKVCTKPEDDRKIRLVWIGSRVTIGYLAEIKPALEEIGSRFNNVVLRIISDEFLDLQNIPVEKHQWSDQTQVIDLVTGDIGLAPLPDNRFTRGKCGFKVLQYAAAGLPVVASPVGVNAEYVKDSVEGFLVKDLTQWVDRISTLVENPDLRRKMGSSAKVIASDFDIAVIGKRLYQIISNCITQVRFS